MAIKLGGIELATPGDIIVGGGAYALGFGVDAFFFSGGATSATTAGAFAVGALSLKYAVQAAFGSKKKPPEHKETSSKSPQKPVVKRPARKVRLDK